VKIITSTQNNTIKQLLQLQSKAKSRKEHKQFVVEGRRELDLAHANGYSIQTVYWCPEIFEELHFMNWREQFNETIDFVRVSLSVYQKMVMREKTEGLIGIVLQKTQSLKEFHPKNDNPLIIVLESIEKPGNLGAVLRTADAAAVDAVLITEQHTDIHNPNVIRSSVGGFFSVPTFVCSNEEAYNFMSSRNIKIYAASLQKSKDYSLGDFLHASAFVMGSEAIGLSEFWSKEGIEAVKIPMLGHVDSLNVSVATAVLTYEAMRQRNP
jgi:RNA methyltransferase, TrmH family